MRPVRACGIGVIIGQCAFLACGYSHALLRGDLSLQNSHISAVIDHKQASLLCGLISVASGAALVALELTRPIALRGLRVALALNVSVGILTTCIVRESSWYLVHALSACIAFGAAMLLVCIVARCQPAHARKTECMRLASLLFAACFITGVAQGSYLLKLTFMPSFALAVGECSMVLGFGLAVSVSSSGVDACVAHKRCVHKS
mmetsp:Transcript_30487/g.50503  ORF Transcript_30487/g.50503 Transcript_30487/m.50503 type:complete len:204 (+) Transcript_30487:33-644(+)